MRLSRPDAAKDGHSLTAFLKPWMCWAWGSLGARPLVSISTSSFLFPFFCRTAWPSAPERLRGFSSALKWFLWAWLLWSSSRSSRAPPLAKATEAKLSDRSEEHTSELQSRQYLVCRLLLEKKNNHNELKL